MRRRPIHLFARMLRAALLIAAAPLACTAYTPDALLPSPSPLQSRLLPLRVDWGVGVEPGDRLRREEARAVAFQSDLVTVLRQDFEANVFDAGGQRWGFADYRLAHDADAVTKGGAALTLLNALTLFVPALLGAPISVRERSLEVEIVIYDSRRVEIARHVVVGRANYRPSIYVRDFYRRGGIDAAKNVMEKYRAKLGPDVQRINTGLRATGPVTSNP